MMKTQMKFVRLMWSLFAVLLLAGVLVAVPALASESSGEVTVAQDRCQVLGQQEASVRNAVLVATAAKTVDGEPSCEIVLLLPANDGGRQKREVVILAQ